MSADSKQAGRLTWIWSIQVCVWGGGGGMRTMVIRCCELISRVKKSNFREKGLMVLFTSLDHMLKIWRGLTSEKCGRNSVGSHFEITRSRNRQSGKIVISNLI